MRAVLGFHDPVHARYGDIVPRLAAFNPSHHSEDNIRNLHGVHTDAQNFKGIRLQAGPRSHWVSE
jgi:hypothetical protein